MRSRTHRFALFALGFSLFACADDEPDVAAATSYSAPPAIGSGGRRRPRHGGTVTQVGTHPVELVAHSSGQVYAYVGSDVRDPTTSAMQLEVPVSDGRRPVQMTWDSRRRRYEGLVVDATIVGGPINVNYVVDGVPLIAILPVFVIAPAIEIVVDVDHHHGKHKWRH